MNKLSLIICCLSLMGPTISWEETTPECDPSVNGSKCSTPTVPTVLSTEWSSNCPKCPICLPHWPLPCPRCPSPPFPTFHCPMPPLPPCDCPIPPIPPCHCPIPPLLPYLYPKPPDCVCPKVSTQFIIILIYTVLAARQSKDLPVVSITNVDPSRTAALFCLCSFKLLNSMAKFHIFDIKHQTLNRNIG